MLNELRVLARGGILVLDVAHAEAAVTRGHRAYVGRRTVRAWKLKDLPEDCPRHEHHNDFLENGQPHIPHCAYPRRKHAVAVPNTSYYRKQLKKGALWAADEATALECGAKFDPTFGGEYPALVKAAAKDRGKDGEQ